MDFSRFFAPEVTLEELAALEAALAETGRVRHGGGLTLRRGRLRGGRDGTHCERIFGPLQVDRCLCGKYAGEPRRGARCDRCGVEVGDPAVRASRWGHVYSRVGIAHPALLARAAADLGSGERPLVWPEACAEGRDDCGDVPDEEAGEGSDPAPPLDALEERAGRPLRVRHIPVSPPAGRVAPPLPRGLLPIPTAEEVAVARLVDISARLDRLDEIGAPRAILASVAESAAKALEELVAARSAPAARSIWSGEGSGEPPRLTGRRPPPGPRARSAPHVDGVAFWGNHLVLTGRGGLRVVSLTSGRGKRVPAGPCHVLGVVGDVAVLDGIDAWPVFDRGRREEAASLARVRAGGYGAVHLSTGRWLDALPGAPRIRFGKDQPEDGWAEDLTGRAADLRIPSDRPAFGCYTPALDAMLVLGDDAGPLLDGDTGFPLFDLGAFAEEEVPVEGSGRRVRLGWDYGRGGPPAVVPLGGRRWRVLVPGGAVGEIGPDGASLRWALRGRHSAAAFSPDGARLAVAHGRRVRVFRPDGVVERTVEV
jgi:hypothetical protein